MTGPDFRRLCEQRTGAHYGWQSSLARELGVSSRTMRRWLKDGAPPHIVKEIESIDVCPRCGQPF